MYQPLPAITGRPLTEADWRLWQANFTHFASIFEVAGASDLLIGTGEATFGTLEDFDGLLTAGSGFLVEIPPPASDSLLFRTSQGHYEWSDIYLLQQLYGWLFYDSVL